jgi:ABC-2 type transport system permease protein
MTAPVRDHEVVLGKWLAALAFFSLLWLPTLPLLWLLSTAPFLGAELAFGPVVAGYAGMLLLGALLLAVGCFTSSLTDNQLLASLSSMLFGYGLLAAANTARAVLLGDDPPAWVETLIGQANVSDHLFQWFARGFIDSAHVAFYLAGTLLFLYLTVRAVGSRR